MSPVPVEKGGLAQAPNGCSADGRAVPRRAMAGPGGTRGTRGKQSLPDRRESVCSALWPPGVCLHSTTAAIAAVGTEPVAEMDTADFDTDWVAENTGAGSDTGLAGSGTGWAGSGTDWVGFGTVVGIVVVVRRGSAALCCGTQDSAVEIQYKLVM